MNLVVVSGARQKNTPSRKLRIQLIGRSRSDGRMPAPCGVRIVESMRISTQQLSRSFTGAMR
ncbi:MAG: hypothetical protein IPI01_18040 [Ignavibacteriae bacterium]|nr:hypothetical protein [Ignavibacteriota bacterium]